MTITSAWRAGVMADDKKQLEDLRSIAARTPAQAGRRRLRDRGAAM
jgi:hypothetical protein